MTGPLVKMKVGSPSQPREEHEREHSAGQEFQMMKAEPPHSTPGLGQSGGRGRQAGVRAGRKKIYPDPELEKAKPERSLWYPLLLWISWWDIKLMLWKSI